MTNCFFVTNQSSQLTNKIISANPIFEKYNSNLGYLLSKFIRQKLYEKGFDGKLPLHRKNFLRKILPDRKLDYLMKELIRLNVIKKGNYVPNEHSTLYSVVYENFYNFENVDVKTVKDKFLLRNLKRLNEFRFNSLPDINKDLENLLKYFSLDITKAKEYINKNSISLYESTISKYEMIISLFENYTYTILDRYGRMHSKITNFPSKLRQFISINGNNKTSTIDIKTSQPLFLYCYLCNQRDNTKQELLEYEKYYQLLIEKDLYSSFESTKNIEDRQKRKEEFFAKIIFGNYKYCTKYDVNKEFKDMFPLIHKRIETLSLKQANLLPCAMQRVEASFIFNSVVPKILTEIPDIKLATIHDSVFCETIFAEKVKEIFEKCFRDNFKKEVQLKMVNFNS